MRDAAFAVSTLLLGTILTVANPFTAQSAHASSHQTKRAPTAHIVGHTRLVSSGHLAAGKGRRYAKVHHVAGISCVPFARRDSGIEVSGNAWEWWDNAAGVYARGHMPQPGSVLAFRSNPHMRLGHVAVVTKVINPREIEIDHANWAGGGVSRGIAVVDVSEANDWTAVRVALGHGTEFGSVYPTYGFIYDHADTGTMVAAAHAPTPQPDLNPPMTDLRPAAERPWQVFEEVAEAPAAPRHVVMLTQNGGGRVGSLDHK